MSLIAKPDKSSLWSVTPLIALCVMTTFAYWMAPLGLGFSDQVGEKLNSPPFFKFFIFVYWVGPFALMVALGALLISGFGFLKKSKLIG